MQIVLDIWIHIASFCDVQTLTELRVLCRDFNTAVTTIRQSAKGTIHCGLLCAGSMCIDLWNHSISWLPLPFEFLRHVPLSNQQTTSPIAAALLRQRKLPFQLTLYDIITKRPLLQSQPTKLIRNLIHSATEATIDIDERFPLTNVALMAENELDNAQFTVYSTVVDRNWLPVRYGTVLVHITASVDSLSGQLTVRPLAVASNELYSEIRQPIVALTAVFGRRFILSFKDQSSKVYELPEWFSTHYQQTHPELRESDQQLGNIQCDAAAEATEQQQALLLPPMITRLSNPLEIGSVNQLVRVIDDNHVIVQLRTGILRPEFRLLVPPINDRQSDHTNCSTTALYANFKDYELDNCTSVQLTILLDGRRSEPKWIIALAPAVSHISIAHCYFPISQSSKQKYPRRYLIASLTNPFLALSTVAFSEYTQRGDVRFLRIIDISAGRLLSRSQCALTTDAASKQRATTSTDDALQLTCEIGSSDFYKHYSRFTPGILKEFIIAESDSEFLIIVIPNCQPYRFMKCYRLSIQQQQQQQQLTYSVKFTTVWKSVIPADRIYSSQSGTYALLGPFITRSHIVFLEPRCFGLVYLWHKQTGAQFVTAPEESSNGPFNCIGYSYENRVIVDDSGTLIVCHPLKEQKPQKRALLPQGSSSGRPLNSGQTPMDIINVGWVFDTVKMQFAFFKPPQ